jgi:hypothetical protein
MGSDYSKSLWEDTAQASWNFFCPLCKKQRRLRLRSRPGGFRQISQIVLTSFFFTLVCWPWFGWKGSVSFVPLWSGFEIIYRWRLRAALTCRDCGFDPYLFTIDFKMARDAVEAFWRKKFADKGITYPERKGNPGPSTPSLEVSSTEQPKNHPPLTAPLGRKETTVGK